jgi:hypothetical protein
MGVNIKYQQGDKWGGDKAMERDRWMTPSKFGIQDTETVFVS